MKQSEINRKLKLIETMDTYKFERCISEVLIREKVDYEGIGTLSEKSVHSILKHYLSDDLSKQEIKIGSYFADVFTGQEIFEIQTRAFYKLRSKLEFFLQTYPVTVVYPLSNYNSIRWVNPLDGEISKPKKSSRKGKPVVIFDELYGIRSFLKNPNLKIKILLMDTEEYRFLDGYGKDSKKHATKCDKFPKKLVEEIDLTRPEDYMIFLPEELPEEFVAKDFAKVHKIGTSLADIALLLMTEMGVVERVGKKGRAYLYKAAY